MHEHALVCAESPPSPRWFRPRGPRDTPVNSSDTSECSSGCAGFAAVSVSRCPCQDSGCGPGASEIAAGGRAGRPQRGLRPGTKDHGRPRGPSGRGRILPTSPFPDERLTLAEPAARLKAGRTTVNKLITSGAVPSYRVGRSVRVRRADVERWLGENRQDLGNCCAGAPSDRGATSAPLAEGR